MGFVGEKGVERDDRGGFNIGGRRNKPLLKVVFEYEKWFGGS